MVIVRRCVSSIFLNLRVRLSWSGVFLAYRVQRSMQRSLSGLQYKNANLGSQTIVKGPLQ
jgi:hypothetical protein